MHPSAAAHRTAMKLSPESVISRCVFLVAFLFASMAVPFGTGKTNFLPISDEATTTLIEVKPGCISNLAGADVAAGGAVNLVS